MGNLMGMDGLRNQHPPKQQLSVREILCVRGVGDPDRCPQASGGRLFLTEAKWI